MNENISLGFTRLAINDLTTDGIQPMENEDGTIILVFNGEIYNFQELKKDLKEKGHIFKSESDSEVIIHAYEEEGIECVKKFNGMWAFALYDKKNNMFYLSRDRVGIKPLYFYYKDGDLIFASELKSIIKVMKNYGIEPQINKTALNIYLSLGYVPEPFSIYTNIWKVRKAHNLFFSLKSRNGIIQRYWKLPTPKYIENEKDIVSEGRLLLRQIVQDMKVADVEVGTFLSGGLDSTTVTALLNEQKKKELHTFSIGSADKTFDESKYSNIAAEKFGTQHHHYKFK
jgi:asparagine synthase (glutamine-hydrolysing)